MNPRNCIEHACNRAMREPVYVVLRPTAKRRPWPHVVTVGPTSLQSFFPGAPSPHPIDVALAAVVGCVGALLWVAGRLIKRMVKRV